MGSRCPCTAPSEWVRAGKRNPAVNALPLLLYTASPPFSFSSLPLSSSSPSSVSLSSAVRYRVGESITWVSAYTSLQEGFLRPALDICTSNLWLLCVFPQSLGLGVSLALGQALTMATFR